MSNIICAVIIISVFIFSRNYKMIPIWTRLVIGLSTVLFFDRIPETSPYLIVLAVTFSLVVSVKDEIFALRLCDIFWIFDRFK